jgi:preprotein translocase subunit SecB
MADEDNAATPGAAPEGSPTEVQPQGPGIRILAQFIRDLSFENPRAPESLRGEGPPKIDLDVELSARNRPDGLNEVDLKLTVGASRGEDIVFHVEVLFGGLFQIEGVPPDELEPVLLIECPRYLFPFARRIVADLTGEGGFPPFRMDPIDFAGIYMARRAQGGGAGPNGGGGGVLQA